MKNIQMREYIYPSFLCKNYKAVIVSPSGKVQKSYVDGAKSILDSWGLKTEIATHAIGSYKRFSGTVSQRLFDLQNALDDPTVKLILCSRGGYGAVHLLPYLRYNKLRKYPKWLVGYSDITILHQAFLKNNITSLHAPMARHLTEEQEDASIIHLKNILFGDIPNYDIPDNPLNIKGEATGRLFGGNLAILCSLIGSKYFRIPTDGILFIEDIGERPYQIDRMMWTLKLSGILNKLKGLIIGSFTECQEDKLNDNPVYESIHNMVKDMGFPVCFDFPVGHDKNNFPLIHGGAVKLKTGKYVLLENIII